MTLPQQQTPSAGIFVTKEDLHPVMKCYHKQKQYMMPHATEYEQQMPYHVAVDQLGFRFVSMADWEVALHDSLEKSFGNFGSGQLDVLVVGPLDNQGGPTGTRCTSVELSDDVFQFLSETLMWTIEKHLSSLFCKSFLWTLSHGWSQLVVRPEFRGVVFQSMIRGFSLWEDDEPMHVPGKLAVPNAWPIGKKVNVLALTDASYSGSEVRLLGTQLLQDTIPSAESIINRFTIAVPVSQCTRIGEFTDNVSDPVRLQFSMCLSKFIPQYKVPDVTSIGQAAVALEPYKHGRAPYKAVRA